MPFPLIFLVPPAVLIDGTRKELPRRKDSSLAAWLQARPEVRLRFADVAASLVPVVRESLVFAASRAALVVDQDVVRSSPLPRGARAMISANTRDVREVLKKAQFVGKWYANAGTVETIMSLWGVRP